MSTLPVSVVVSVSVAAAQPGLLVPNVSNLCILDTEAPANPGNLTNNLGIYSSAQQVATDWGTGSEAYQHALAAFGQKPNMLAGGGQLMIYHMTGGVTTLSQAIAAMESTAYAGAYNWAGYNPINSEILAAVAVCNAIGSGKPIPASTYLSSDLNSGGLLYQLAALNEPAGIPILYTQAGTALGARLAATEMFAAQMVTNFSGQNTTVNLNLKTLQGLAADTGITSAILTQCQNLGVYVYASIQGVAKVIANGGPNNNFFDNVYNLNWFSNAIQIAIFNALATTNTKIPQTEAGMQVIKNAVLSVCQQAVINGYLAPGTWNGVDTFGNQASFLRNIAQLGYYLYSAPVGAQSQAVRATRAAPLMQLAAKLAGAIDTASIIVTIQP